MAEVEAERDALLAELGEAEAMAAEEASFTRENLRQVQAYAGTLEGMQAQVRHTHALTHTKTHTPTHTPTHTHTHTPTKTLTHLYLYT